MNKAELTEIVRELPEGDIDIDALIDRLQLLRRVEASERAIREGSLLSQTEAVRRSREWFK